MSADESYADSVIAVVNERGVEVVSLKELYEWVYQRRKCMGLLSSSDLKSQNRRGCPRWKHRVRSAVWGLRKTGRAVKVGRAKYRFLL